MARLLAQGFVHRALPLAHDGFHRGSTVYGDDPVDELGFVAKRPVDDCEDVVDIGLGVKGVLGHLSRFWSLTNFVQASNPCKHGFFRRLGIPEIIFSLRSREALPYRYSIVMMEQAKSGARKRTFVPEQDVGTLLGKWEQENRHVIFSRMVNDALRDYLRDYALKRHARNGRKAA